MRKVNDILKLSVVLLLFVGSMTSCLKDEEDPYASFTPEREATLIHNWRTQMKKSKVNVDSFMVENTKIYFVIDTTKVGSGPNVKTGDNLTVKYTGLFLDGSIFDASKSYSYIHKDTDNTKRMITGWEASIEHLNKGASAAFLIPSAQAYGTTGSYGGIIPPNSPLIFVIEVLDIK